MSHPDKVSIYCYGLAEWGCNAIETFFRINLLIYCTDTLNLSPGTAGIIVAVGVVWDGITDPIVGTLSDHFNSRWGRRIPLMFLGMITLPLVIWGLFSIAPGATFLTWKFAILYLLCNTALTLIAVPHAALAGDISRDGKVRNQVFAVRYFYTIVGLLTGIALPGYIFQKYGISHESYVIASSFIAMIIFVTSLISIGVSRRFESTAVQEPSSMSPLKNMQEALKNRLFIILVLAFLAATIGQSINASIALYYYRYRLQFVERDVQSILILFSLVITLSLPVWYYIANKVDKAKLLSSAIILLGMLGSIGYPLFPPKILSPIYAMAIVGGILVGSVFLLEVMLADIVDNNTSSGEQANYGVYFGIWKFSAKLARAGAIGLSGLLLELIGFSSQVSQQSLSTIRGIGILFGPGVGLFFIMGGLIVLLLGCQSLRSFSSMKSP